MNIYETNKTTFRELLILEYLLENTPRFVDANILLLLSMMFIPKNTANTVSNYPGFAMKSSLFSVKYIKQSSIHFSRCEFCVTAKGLDYFPGTYIFG